MSSKPNVVFIVSDTVRADHLSVYGNKVVQTPALDKFTESSCVFNNCHTASFPTGPMRKDLLTGKYTAFYSSWGDEIRDVKNTLPAILQRGGYQTARIADTSNVRCDFDFQEEEFIEGQGGQLSEDDKEDINDYVMTAYEEEGAQGNNEYELKLPAPLRKLRVPPERVKSLLYQEKQWNCEEERFAPRTMRKAHAWLEKQTQSEQPFFLMVDTFDPHEPWNPPQYYIDKYAEGYDGPVLFEPAYEPSDYAAEEEIKHMRALYAAELTMVDYWIGFLLDGLKNMNLWEDTIIVFVSDHGFYHGEHGLIGKVQLDREGNLCGRYPLYSTITHVPLFIKLQGTGNHKMVNGLCQPVDIMPTILERLDIKSSVCQGQSLLTACKEGKTNRKAAVSSLTTVMDEEVRSPASFRTNDYFYIYGGDEWENELYDLSVDSEEQKNIIADNTNLAKEMHQDYVDFLKEMKAPSYVLKARKDFPQEKRENIPYKKLI